VSFYTSDLVELAFKEVPASDDRKDLGLKDGRVAQSKAKPRF